jgi:hypothetical protein
MVFDAGRAQNGAQLNAYDLSPSRLNHRSDVWEALPQLELRSLFSLNREVGERLKPAALKNKIADSHSRRKLN